jgi:hypothetical protein
VGVVLKFKSDCRLKGGSSTKFCTYNFRIIWLFFKVTSSLLLSLKGKLTCLEFIGGHVVYYWKNRFLKLNTAKYKYHVKLKIKLESELTSPVILSSGLQDIWCFLYDLHYQNGGLILVFLNSNKTLPLVIAYENLTGRHLVGWMLKH